MTQFDLVIIGGGPGGYVAAIRAAQHGQKVACIEQRETLGGTCLNVGCIPSKALLNITEKFVDMREHGADLGIQFDNLGFNLDTILKKKDKIVADLTKGIDFLFKKNKITRYIGVGHIDAVGKVSVHNNDGSVDNLTTKNIIIATGSEVTTLAHLPVDGKKVVTSTEALEFKNVPKTMVVIGGGYIGLEMGSVWARLGTDVHVIEAADTIVPAMDKDISKEFLKILKKQGMTFHLGNIVEKIESTKNDHVSIHIRNKNDDAKTLDADIALMSIGRRPFTNGLGLDQMGVIVDERGFIQVDEHFQTNIHGIYAIGDVVPGPMLAHKAEEDGIACVDGIMGHYAHVNYKLIPGIVYTSPEVATVGYTEDELKSRNSDYKKGKFPFLANSRAKATGHTDGFVKILSDKITDQVLGVHIIGHDAGTLIMEAVAVMEFGGTTEDITHICHGHPTLNEAIKEAALDVDKKAIHQ